MKTATFFDTREELRELTGLPSDDHDAALWDSGFILDDCDFGFVSDSEWSGVWEIGKNPYYEWWLMLKMDDSYCVRHVEYLGRHYYLKYHS